jgi:hypothetical protein
MYQPAAAAEARFAASLRTGSSASSSSSSSSSSSESAADAVVTQEPSTPSQQLSPTEAPDVAALDPQQRDVSISEQLHKVVPDVAKDLARDILREDNRARTKQLVDDAWQSLE